MNAIGLYLKNKKISDIDKTTFIEALHNDGSNIVDEKNYLLVDSSKTVQGVKHVLRNAEVNVLLYGYISNIENLIDKNQINSQQTVQESLCDLYKIYGESFLSKLKGAFALILFDNRNEKVIAAKDHLSMKPLYYCHKSEDLIIATNQSAIYRQSNFTRSTNDLRVAEYLNGIIPRSDHNFFNDILSVPRSSYLVFENKKLEVKKYFNFDIHSPIVLKNDSEYAECTREIFLKTLENHSKIFRKFASKLSGGLDSTSICCGLSNISSESNFPCINIDYEGLESELLAYSDEEKYVDIATSFADLNTIKAKIRVGEFPVINYLRELYSQSDILVPSFNQGFQIGAFSVLNKLGYDAVFDGYDGDSAISFGKERLLKLRREHNFLNFYYEKFKYAKKHDLKFSTLGTLKHILLTAQESKTKVSEHDLHCKIFDYYGWDYAFEYTENNANMYGVEEVYPFFDRDLMQYLISIPAEQKLKHGYDRYHFRNAMRNIIPDEVRKRTKKGILSRLWTQEVKNIDIKELASIFKRTNSDHFFDTQQTLEELSKFKIAGNTKGDSGLANSLFQRASLSLWLEKYQ